MNCCTNRRSGLCPKNTEGQRSFQNIKEVGLGEKESTDIINVQKTEYSGQGYDIFLINLLFQRSHKIWYIQKLEIVEFPKTFKNYSLKKLFYLILSFDKDIFRQYIFNAEISNSQQLS